MIAVTTEYFSVFIDDGMPYLLMLSNKNSAKHTFSFHLFWINLYIVIHRMVFRISQIIRQHMMWFTPINGDTKECS